eukprot:jgi/Psemu1/285011/fgenesh1_pg.70_\
MTRRFHFSLSRIRKILIALSCGFALRTLKWTSQMHRSLLSDLVDTAELEMPTTTHIRAEPEKNTVDSAQPRKERGTPEGPSDFGNLDPRESSKLETLTTLGKSPLATRPFPRKEGVFFSARGNETDTLSEIDGSKHNNVHVVVSHCNKPIGWIWKEYFGDLKNRTSYSIRSITIISKCDIPIPLADLPYHSSINKPDQTSRLKPTELVPLVTVVSLPNVGRCDHSYAYWITKVLMGKDQQRKVANSPNTSGDSVLLQKNYNDYEVLYSNQKHNGNKNNRNDDPFEIISRDIDPADLILFMKDNNNAYRGDIEGQVTVLNMFDSITNNGASNLTQASPAGKGMSCASFLVANGRGRRFTNWAHRSVMWTFRLKRYARETYLNTTATNVTTNLTTDRHNTTSGSKNPASLHKYNFRSDYRPMGEWIKHLSTRTTSTVSSSPLTSAEQQQQQQLLVFSREYLDSAVREVHKRNGFYYNFTHNINTTSEHYNTLDLLPMCYGGVFSTQWGQLSSRDAPITTYGWNVVTNALSRGDNIEEGHYMERWWGDILSWSSYSSRSLATNSSDGGSGERPRPDPRRRRRPHRSSGGVLTTVEQKDLLSDKLRHWNSNSPYVGLLILRSEQERRRPKRADIIANWEAIRAVQIQLRSQRTGTVAARRA